MTRTSQSRHNTFSLASCDLSLTFLHAVLTYSPNGMDASGAVNRGVHAHREYHMAFSDIVITLNRWLMHCRRPRVAPTQLLLLIPHCLHRKSCVREVETDLDACAGCGQCKIAELIQLRDEFGIQCRIAGGGRQAVELVRHPDVKAVIAVACEKELGLGLLHVFPKPVITVPNLRPEGFCKNTAVDIHAVRAAIQRIIRQP